MTTTSLDELIAARERFVSFVRSKFDDPELAEDIVQNSLLKAVKGVDSLTDADKLIPWFYAILRNAITDAYRTRASHPLPVDISDVPDLEDLPAEIQGVLCECFQALLPTLPPQYAEVLQRLDLDNESSETVRQALNVSAGNLKVRHHRARQALKARLEETCRTCAEHHCLDCTCGAGK